MKTPRSIIGLSVLLLGLAACTPIYEDTATSTVQNVTSEEPLETTSGALETASDSEAPKAALTPGELLAGKTSPLRVFTQADYDEAVKSGKLVVLYFYANWCPECLEETKNALLPAFNELEEPNVVGFRVNFKDNETDADEDELARKFGVAYQHTKVFVLKDERLMKDPANWQKEMYLTAIKNALQ